MVLDGLKFSAGLSVFLFLSCFLSLPHPVNSAGIIDEDNLFLPRTNIHTVSDLAYFSSFGGFHHKRTSIDLKDKWRNLCKAREAATTEAT